MTEQNSARYARRGRYQMNAQVRKKRGFKDRQTVKMTARVAAFIAALLAFLRVLFGVDLLVVVKSRIVRGLLGIHPVGESIAAYAPAERIDQ